MFGSFGGFGPTHRIAVLAGLLLLELRGVAQQRPVLREATRDKAFLLHAEK